MKVLYLGSNEKKNSGKDLNNIEASFTEGKSKKNSLNVKGKLNNIGQVQMKY